VRELAQSIIEAVPEELHADMEREFRRGWHMEAVKAEVNQRRLAQVAHRDGKVRSVNGLGRLRMRIDPIVFHYWGQRLGYACWDDKQFLHEFERDNPEVRVKSGGTQIQVGYR